MTLQVGDPAPDFTLRDQHGRRTSLSALRGERAVVIVFFPFAFSGVCTGELRELRERADQIAQAGAQLLAVSCDPMFALRAFADQDGLEFALLSDFWPHGEVASAYEVFDQEHGCPTRSSFVVDREGIVRWSVHNPMGEPREVADYLSQLGALDATSVKPDA
ncbi:MAG TPA: peroxiredoxin [Nocardioidaceae bacterium]|nr:peroxiredoxin [Nocardioidaceae bacterium]